jgi:hypothetical protein
MYLQLAKRGKIRHLIVNSLIKSSDELAFIVSRRRFKKLFGFCLDEETWLANLSWLHGNHGRKGWLSFCDKCIAISRSGDPDTGNWAHSINDFSFVGWAREYFDEWVSRVKAE